jgi:hypothetical protein
VTRAVAFASGKHALGLCDRCGQTFRLNDLKSEVTKGRPNGWKVCWQCCDKDHPQLRQGEQPVVDPQALKDPRPDRDRDTSRALTGEVVYPPINGAEYGEGE